jgi:hypothetical protein
MASTILDIQPRFTPSTLFATTFSYHHKDFGIRNICMDWVRYYSPLRPLNFPLSSGTTRSARKTMSLGFRDFGSVLDSL